MNASIPMVGFGAFLGGLLVFSRVASWVAYLVLVFGGSTKVEGRTPAAFSLTPLVLHSGPWSLAITIGAICYVASRAQPVWLWAVLGGLGLAVVAQFAAFAFAYVRQRKLATSVPLTPGRLLKIRRRFFWVTSLYFGGCSAAWLLYQLWPYFGRSLVLMALVIVVCLGVGYLFAWLMWQWYGASLEAREELRRRQERENAV